MVDTYFTIKPVKMIPRLPLEGNIDLTYRCNNNCLHCWLRIPPGAPEKRNELRFDELISIIDEARAMGCRTWSISGGEPMLRPDFPEIFDYITRKSVNYSLNTNGTLITPAIAQLLKRKGNKMVALYGATAEVYDAVTRHPGGFEQVMRGISYLKEAGAGFTIQLIPMRANWHQWDQMQELAKSLSPLYRIGAAWLYLSSSGSIQKNREIAEQRLSPREVIELDKPDLTFDEWSEENDTVRENPCAVTAEDDRLIAQCVTKRRIFHIDAYGGMTFCSFIVDPALRYNLRDGSFREAWEQFIPSLADKVRGGDEWREGCGSCERRPDCIACAAHSYLETRHYSKPIPFLCAVAKEAHQYKKEWQEKHRRYFQIAGITIQVESDLDFDEIKFKPEFDSFRVEGPGNDNVTLRHYFDIPDLRGKNLGKELYRKVPWLISRDEKNGTYFYRGTFADGNDVEIQRLAVFKADYSRAAIYNLPEGEDLVRKAGWPSLSLFPTDQIWLAPLLASRRAVLIHSAAAIVNGQGLVFVGHSEAGKSTTVNMLKNAHTFSETSLQVEILCDDRNILRRWVDGWRVYGTWSHGDVSDVSSGHAPLRAILFLLQDTCNEIKPLTDRKEIWKRLLATLIKPMVTAEWWRKELDLLEQIVQSVPCYTMRFDKSGAIVGQVAGLVKNRINTHNEFNIQPSIFPPSAEVS